MILYYKDKKGQKLKVSGLNILSANCTAVEVSVVYDDGIGRPAKKNVITENDGKRYFIWNNERVYLGDYWSIKPDALHLYCMEENVDEIIVFASFMKFANDIAIITGAVPYSASLPNIPADIYSEENPSEMLYSVSQNDFANPVLYFAPNSKDHWKYFSNVTYSIADIIAAIKNGTLEIVSKKSFIEKYKEDARLFAKMSNFKKKRYQKKNGVFRKVLL